MLKVYQKTPDGIPFAARHGTTLPQMVLGCKKKVRSSRKKIRKQEQEARFAGRIGYMRQSGFLSANSSRIDGSDDADKTEAAEDYSQRRTHGFIETF